MSGRQIPFFNSHALRGLNYAVLGDSKTTQGVSAGATGWRSLFRGYWGQAVNLSGVPLNLVSVCATGGWKLADMLTAFDAQVAAYSPDYILFYGGVNDIQQTVGSQTSVASIKATLAAIYNKCEAIGAKVIKIGIPPAASSVGAFYIKPLIARIQDLNRWDEDYCLKRGWKFVNPWLGTIHGQPTNSSGHAITANYYDAAIHESAIGAYILAKAVAAEIVALTGYDKPGNSLATTYVDSLTNTRSTVTSITGDGTTATATLAGHTYVVGDEVTLWSSSNTAENVKDYYGVKEVTAITTNTFSYACTESAATVGTLYASTGFNLCDKSMLTGTTGTKTVITGNIADDWDATATAGMTVSALQPAHTKWSAAPGSTDAADYDSNGNWQEFTIASAANNDTLLFGYAVPDTKALRGGNNYICEVEVEVYGTIVNLRSVYLRHTVNWTATGSFLAGIDIRDNWDGSLAEAGPTEARKFVLRTPIWNSYFDAATTLSNDSTMPTGTFGLANGVGVANINNGLTVGAEFAGVGSAVIRVGTPRLVRV